MTKRLQATVGVDRQPTTGVELASQNVFPAVSSFGEAQILHQHDLGRRETVVHLGHRQLRTRTVNTSLAVGISGGLHDFGKGGEVKVLIHRTPGRARH